MTKKETITAYCSSRIKFNNINDFFTHSINHGYSFYNTLPNHSSIEASTDYDKEFDSVIHDAKSTELPAYLYSLSIKRTDKIINGEKELETTIRENLRTLLKTEYKGSKSNVGHKTDISYLDHPECTLNYVMQNIRFDFTEEHIIGMMKLLNIDAVYSIKDPFSLNDNEHILKIYNRDIISNSQCQQIMSSLPSSYQKIHGNISISPENFIKDIFSNKTFGRYSQVHIYELKNDSTYQDFIFRTIKSEFNSYSHDQFMQDIEGISHKLSHLNVSAIKNNIENEYRIIMPQTISDLNNLGYATTEHVSKKQLENMEIGYHHATKLRIRESDGQMFVTKKMGRSLMDACRSEYEAYQIYEAFGVKVPQTHLIEDELYTTLVMEYINGNTLKDYIDFPDISSDIAFLSTLRGKISSDYAIDALLCNPDTGSYHDENIIMKLNDNEPYRIDLGFALNYHAHGVKKESYQWQKVHIADFYSFRASNAAKSYGGLKNDDMLNRLLKAQTCLSKVKKVASKENFDIINQRLKMAIKHFAQLSSIEKSFQDNKKDTSQKRTLSKEKKPHMLSARQKKIALSF